MKPFFNFLICLAFTSSCFGQAGNIDLTFNPNDPGYSNGAGCDAAVRAIRQLASGKILVAGSFDQYDETTKQVARLNLDGSLDNLFGTGTVVSGTINTILPQSSGKILIGGEMYYFDGPNQLRHIARLTPFGLLDLNLNVGFSQNYNVNTMIEQADEKVIVVGDFTNFLNLSKNRIVRLNLDGSFDDTFVITTGFNSEVFDVKLQGDQKVICGGKFSSYNGTSSSRIIRLNTDGSIDDTFSIGSGFNNDVKTLLILDDGKIIVGGLFTSYNGTAVNHIARLNPDGSLDDTFIIGEGFSGDVISTSIQSDQKIIAVGQFTMYNGITCGKLARLNADGSLDESFISGTGLSGTPYTTLVLADGSILVGGGLTYYNEMGVGNLIRVLPNGDLDMMFHPYSGLQAATGWPVMALQSDGDMLIGGTFDVYNGESHRNIVRLLADGNGEADPDFNAQTDLPLRDVSLQTDQRILIAGYFTEVNDVAVPHIARLLPSGALDPSFQPAISESFTIATSMVMQADGKILVAVNLNQFDCKIFRLLPDGNLDNTFFSGLFINTYGCSILLQEDQKILVKLNNTGTYDGNVTGRLMRLNADGTYDSGFTPVTNSSVLDMKLTADQKILISRSSNNPYDRLIRLNSNGTVDPEFDMGSLGSYTGYPNIEKMAIQENGKIVIAGEFSSINSFAIEGVARLNENGSIDEGYNPLEGISNYDHVDAIALDQQERLLVIGDFTELCGVGKNHIARLLSGDLITEPLPDSVVCRGEAMEVSYTTIGGFGSGNVFSVELSDAAGLFTAPIVLNSAPGTTSGSIMVTIPEDVDGSDLYRIRVAASDPPYKGLESGPFTIYTFDNHAYYHTVQHFLYTSATEGEYQWVDCYNDFAPIEGATSVNYTPTSTSSYAVEVTLNGCTELSNCVVVLGIDENKNHISPSIYPNPNDGSFSLNPGDHVFDSYRVINMIGECIEESKAVIRSNKEITFHAEAGQYVVLLYQDGAVVEKIPVIVR